MEKTISYLKAIFGDNIQIIKKNENNFPIYMIEKYLFSFIKILNDKHSYVLIKFLDKQCLNINQIKKQMEQIQKYSESIPIFVFDNLRLAQRNILIKNQIPFIQSQNQIYIPTIMIELNQKEYYQKEYSDKFSVAAQVTYIYFLLNDIVETNAPRLAKKIPYSKITLNRALAELVERKLIYEVGVNTRKIYKTIDKKELWEKGKKYLFNPVEKIFYTTFKIDRRELYISNETALARLGTSLNDTNIVFYATTSKNIKNIDKESFINKYDIINNDYLIIEQFKYDPSFLSNNHYIDIISLYAQLHDSNDERIQIALNELLEEEL